MAEYLRFKILITKFCSDHSNRRGFQVPIEFSPKFMKYIKGFPVGKVGPCLHLGGLASFNLAKIPYFHRIKTDSVLKMQIIMIGSAVGLACAFGTPIAGIFLIKNRNQMILRFDCWDRTHWENQYG